MRIGYFNIRGYNDFTIEDWKAKGNETLEITQIDSKQFLDVKEASVLDVRKLAEWKETGIIKGATTIPLGELEKRWEEVKGKENIYIHCRSGWRARLAWSILKNHGVDSKVIFDSTF